MMHGQQNIKYIYKTMSCIAYLSFCFVCPIFARRQNVR